MVMQEADLPRTWADFCMPTTLKYQPGVIVADGDHAIVHGRFSGFGAPVSWIAADILRIEDGVLVEHWGE
jgi:hypothetical protein